MKTEVNRHGAVVTTTVHDAQPHTPLLDELVERMMYPLLHQISERQPVLETEEVSVKPKRKFHYEYECACGRGEKYKACSLARRVRVYEN